MSKLFISLLLIIVGLLPGGEHKSSLEEKLRSQIDTVAVEQESTDEGFDTVEQARNFQEVSAWSEAAYFADLETNQVLIEKNSDTKLPMASITKLMAALIVVERGDLNDVVTVQSRGTRLGDSTMGLANGERLTVYNLLLGALINSGSDAVLALARHTAGSEAEFVALMNERANILGLRNTQFTNPVGWDEPGHYSTAHDLATLTRVALKNPTIKKIVATKSARAVSIGGRAYILTNTNLLLNERYLGAKTGTTYAAGECLASYYSDGEKEVVGVVLKSPNRFLETDYLIGHINSNFIFEDKNIQK